MLENVEIRFNVQGCHGTGKSEGIRKFKKTQGSWTTCGKSGLYLGFNLGLIEHVFVCKKAHGKIVNTGNLILTRAWPPCNC